MKEKIIKAISENDIKNFSLLLSKNFFDFITHAIFSENRTELFKILLKYEKYNPASDNNYAIRNATYRGNLDIVNLLLKDDRVNPAANHNEALYKVFHSDSNDVLQLLFNDIRVSESVNSQNYAFYQLVNEKVLTNKIQKF